MGISPPPNDSRCRIAVVGGGVVGVCCALYLQRDGHSVAIIDPGGPGEACSSGNAGQFVTGYCVPLGLPGIAREVPAMVLDPLGPLTIRWPYLPSLLPWLLRFVAASSPGRVDAIARALHRLNKDSLIAFAPLLEQAGAEHLIQRKGRLDVYQSERVFAKAQVKFDLLRRCGVQVEMLDQKGIRELEPELADRCPQGAFYPESGHTTSPLGLTRLLAEDFVRRGGAILRERVTDFRMGGDGAWSVITDVARHPADQVVVAAGAYSRPLAARLGSRLPLEAERGYHLMLPQAGIRLQRTVVHGDRYFGLTPMEGGMRLAGTVELASVHAKPNFARAHALFQAARQALPALNGQGAVPWMGCRPSMPDSLPVLGRSPLHRSVYFAFGHGHLGLTGAATSGKIIADLVAGRAADSRFEAYRADRF